jgi:hypothetical protein
VARGHGGGPQDRDEDDGHDDVRPRRDLAERVEHLRRLREQQDRSLARKNGGGYTAFICWSLQPDNTEMAGTPKTGGYEYLKTLAISRMYLDNFPNMQSSWVTQGDKVGQMALLYGANDMGSTMLEENVVSQAGATFRMTEQTIRRVIEDLGFVPAAGTCTTSCCGRGHRPSSGETFRLRAQSDLRMRFRRPPRQKWFYPFILCSCSTRLCAVTSGLRDAELLRAGAIVS